MNGSIVDRMTNTNQKAPLHYSAIFNNPISAQILLQNGAEVNITDESVCC